MTMTFAKRCSKQWIYLCVTFFITIIILLTYIMVTDKLDSKYEDMDLSKVMHSAVKNSSDVFTYSDKRLYNIISEIRRRGCVNNTQNRRLCFVRQKCNEYISKLKENVTSINETLYHSELDKYLDTGKCARRYPGAIIIGVYKSGTRALIDFLAMNPNVVIKRAPVYEVSYFDKNADKGNDWYKNQMPYSCDGQLTIEKSPGYFSSVQSPRRIYEFKKDIKLILIVRNPVDRAISHLTFEKYIIEKQYDNNVYNCLFKYNPLRNQSVLNKQCFAIKGSIYDEPMERYLNYFSLRQIHIVDANEFQSSPCRVLKQVQLFLGLADEINCQDFVFNKMKRTYCVKNMKGDGSAKCLSKNRGRQAELSMKYSHVREQLHLFLKHHNERFFKLIGRYYDWH